MSRREALALLGGTGAALVVGIGLSRVSLAQTATPATATPSLTVTPMPDCVVKPALTEGPYFVDVMLNRSDIRKDSTLDIMKDGRPLYLVFQVMDVTDGTCRPLSGAQVDIWHCDANGVYSGSTDPGFDTTGEDWLRGYQVTDEQGLTKFITIYPGWYSGRAVHIHFKIRTDPEAEQGYEFTSQLFFDDDLSDVVFEEAPYADGRGARNTRNDNDNIFSGSDGLLTLTLAPLTDEEAEELELDTTGYKSTFYIGLDLNDDTSGESNFNGAGGQGGRGGPGGRPPGGNGTPRP